MYLEKKFTCNKVDRDLRKEENKLQCYSCNLEIIDFTEYSTQEIIDYFQTRKKGKICGKLYESQFENVDLCFENKCNSRPKQYILGFALVTALSSFSFKENNLNNLTKDRTINTELENRMRDFEEEKSNGAHNKNGHHLNIKIDTITPIPNEVLSPLVTLDSARLECIFPTKKQITWIGSVARLPWYKRIWFKIKRIFS